MNFSQHVTVTITILIGVAISDGHPWTYHQETTETFIEFHMLCACWYVVHVYPFTYIAPKASSPGCKTIVKSP